MKFLTTISKFFKKPNPKYTKNLMYIQDGQVYFNFAGSYMSRAEKALHGILTYNHIYDDKSYYKLYLEYQKHYVIYDTYPILLYCKIPIILSADYEDLHMPDPKEMLELMIPTVEEIKFEVDAKLRVPQFLIDTISNLYDKTSYYFEESRAIPKEYFLRIAQYNYLKEWDYFWYEHKFLTKENRLALYLSTQNEVLMKMGGSDNFFTIKNIIDRYMAEEIENESNKNANLD